MGFKNTYLLEIISNKIIGLPASGLIELYVQSFVSF